MSNQLNILIAGGTGFIGQHLTALLASKNHQITILTRSKAKAKQVFETSKYQFNILEWDDIGHTTIKNFDVIINLCGFSIGQSRWSEAIKNKIIKSRLIPTEKLASICAHLGKSSPRLLNASALSIYPQQTNLNSKTNFNSKTSKHFDENSAIAEKEYDFLSKVALQWEHSLSSAIERKIPLTIMRFAVVLGKDGGALPKMSTPVKYYLGSVLGNGKQLFAWIHIDDLVRGIDFIIEHPKITGAVNLVSPQIINQKTLVQAIGKTFKRPVWLYTPKWMIKLLFGQMGQELLLNGQRAYPQKLLANKFKFKFMQIQEALNNIFR